MGKQQDINFYCYGPRPAHADLPALEATILLTLKDARGFYRTRGMSAALIWSLSGVNVRVALVMPVLQRLEASGFVEEVSADRWRAKR